MLLVVGLGNPGAKYENNRHNFGYLAVDAIAVRHGFGPWRKKFHALLTEASVAGRRVLLMKPLTFMNESGRAIAGAVRFHKLAPRDVLVVHDELDLAPGKLRVKTGGGVAGHNGLRSVASHLGPEFRRVRLGIGHPGDKNRVLSWVLKDFAKADAAWRDPLVDAVADHFPLLVEGDESAFMSKVAQAIRPPAKPAPAASRVLSDVIGTPPDDGGTGV